MKKGWQKLKQWSYVMKIASGLHVVSEGENVALNSSTKSSMQNYQLQDIF